MIQIVNHTKSRRGVPDRRGRLRFADPGQTITIDLNSAKNALGFSLVAGPEPESDPNAERLAAAAEVERLAGEIRHIKSLNKEPLQEYLIEHDVGFNEEDTKPVLLELALAHHASLNPPQ